MKPEHSFEDSSSQPVTDDLTGPLKQTVEEIRAVRVPSGSAARIVERAASWSTSPGVAPAGRRRRARWISVEAIVAVAASAVIAVPLFLFPVPLWHEDEQELVGVKDGGSGAGVPATANDGITPGDDGATPPRGTRGARGGGIPLGASPTRHLAVANDATVLVSTGGETAIRLGDEHPYSTEGTLHIWDWSKSDASRPLEVKLRRAGSTDFAVSPDGKWIVTEDSEIIDLANGESKQLGLFAQRVLGMQFSPDGRALLVLSRSPKEPQATARVFGFPGGEKRLEISGQWAYTFAAALGRDGLFLMDRERFVHRFDARTGDKLRRYEPALDNSVRAIVISPDSKLLVAAGTRGEIYLWEFASGKLLHQLVAEQRYGPKRVRALAFSPDSRRLAGAGAVNLVLWDTGTGQQIERLPTSSGGAVQIRFSRNGRKLTTVHGFVGVGPDTGKSMLRYPTIREWTLESGPKAATGGESRQR